MDHIGLRSSRQPLFMRLPTAEVTVAEGWRCSYSRGTKKGDESVCSEEVRSHTKM